MDIIRDLFSSANKLLFDAVTKNDYGEVNRLITTTGGKITSTNINYKDKDGRTALMLAVERKNQLIVEKILSLYDVNGPKPLVIDEVDNLGQTALFFAIKTKIFDAENVKILKLLRDKGANFNAKDKNGQTALIWAAQNGKTDIVEALIKYGADVDVQDKLGNTALFYASEPIFNLLLNKRANMNIQNKDDQTALMWALNSENTNFELAKLLIKEGADVNIRGKKLGNTALMVAAHKGLYATAKLLIKKKANVNVQDELGMTALMWAAKNGRYLTAELLIENWAKVNATDKNRMTALMYAAEVGYIETVEQLIEKGADVNIKNNDGTTALILYAKNGYFQCVE